MNLWMQMSCLDFCLIIHFGTDKVQLYFFCQLIDVAFWQIMIGIHNDYGGLRELDLVQDELQSVLGFTYKTWLMLDKLQLHRPSSF